MKNKGIIIVVVLVVAVILGAIFLLKKKQSTNAPSAPGTTMNQAPSSQNQEPATAPSSSALKITLNAQNNSGEMGTAELTEIGGRVKVELKLTGAPQNITQPAHIHTGSCANIGAVKYPLTFPVNGVSETMLNIPMSQLLGELPLAINVHKSASEANIYYSCGDIVMPVPGQPAVQQQAPMTNNPGQIINDDRTGGGGQFSTPTDRRGGADKPED